MIPRECWFLVVANLCTDLLNILRFCWPLLCTIFTVVNYAMCCSVSGTPSHCNCHSYSHLHQLTHSILLLLFWAPIARYWSKRWTPRGSFSSAVLSNYSSISSHLPPGGILVVMANSSSCSIFAAATLGACFSSFSFFFKRTLGCIVAHLATSEALDLGDVLLMSVLSLLSLWCKGYIILLLHFQLRLTVVVAPVKFDLEQVSP